MKTLLAFAPDCPVRTLLGIPCPGCGLTRALVLCLRGDLSAAVLAHPLAPILLAQGIVLLVLWFQRWRRGGPVVGIQGLLQRFGWLDCVAILLIWVFRLNAGDIP